MGAWTLLGIFGGAGCGALLRFALNERLNALWTNVPLGTLAANLLGGYLAGLAAGMFLLRGDPVPELRLVVITGFLGGLTTFSAFSLELAAHLQQGRPTWAISVALLHLAGSVALTLLGLGTARLLT